jgi:predicted enzyme related to lactoylglutathione lyase
MPRPIHFEIHADDMDRAQRFYEAVFGWTFAGVENSTFRLIRTGAGPGIDGGMMQRRGPPPQGGEPLNSWVCTLDVDDVDAYVAGAEANGGALALPKMAIPNVGWLAYVKDSEGNILGMMQLDPAAA